MSTLTAGIIERNPAWVQLLGLCPLLAVSSSVTNALGLSIASALVMCGSALMVSALRNQLPAFARLPAFVLIIATFTTLAVLLLEAFAYDVYLRIALFVQIIVTNCMILGRMEAFASRRSVGQSMVDALGTSIGFALALLLLGAAREIIGHGTLFADLDQLFGPSAAAIELRLLPPDIALVAARLPPGAFLTAGLLLALGAALKNRSSKRAQTHSPS